MVEIIGITRATRGKHNKAGNLILAYFDAEFAGVLLKGCALTRLNNDKVTIWPPNLEREADNRRGVRITDDELRREIMRKAIDAYLAIGGTQAELDGDDMLARP